MNFTRVVLTGLLGVAFAGAAVAQIYESVDAEGNRVFTDVPTQGAGVVDLPATNTADAPADIPETAAPEPARPAIAAPGQAATQNEHVDSGGTPVNVEPYEGGVTRPDLRQVNESIPPEEIPAHGHITPREGGHSERRR